MSEKIEISFELLRLACKHFSISYDSYKDEAEPACHHKMVIPPGDSWGICSPDNCPICNREKYHE